MKILDNTTEWVSILEQSHHATFVIFKHSSVCPISARAHEEIEKLDQKYGEKIYKVVVQDSRGVSDAIAEDLEVVHESPQVIIVKDGISVYDESHNEIDSEEVEKALEHEK